MFTTNYASKITNYLNHIKYVGPEPKGLTSNMQTFSDAAKILALDTVIDHAKDVFGPTGGYVGRILGINPNNPEDTKGKRFVKSKDGHKFFSNFYIQERWGDSVLMDIRGLTEYITEYTAGTSRDGTTSLAMVSAAISKFILMTKVINTTPDGIGKNFADSRTHEGSYNIPSTIINILIDVLSEEGSKLIDEHKVLTYDETTKSYKENGFENSLACIKTTVDSDPQIYLAFERLMKQCEKDKLDIKNAFIKFTDERDGSPYVDFELKLGAKFKAGSIDASIAQGIESAQTATFILDGFVSEVNANEYIRELKHFIETLCKIRGPQGLLFDPNGKNPLAPPVFIVTRTPEYLVKLYKEMTIKGITIMDSATNAKFTIKPLFLLAPNEDHNEAKFKDICDCYRESVINLNAIELHINSVRDISHFDQSQFKWKKIEKTEDIEIHQFFPTIGTSYAYNVFEVDPEPIIHEFETGKYTMYKPRPVERIETDINVIFYNIAFDGTSVFMKSLCEELDNRTKAKREELQKAMDAYGAEAADDTVLQDRIDMFSGITVVPVIYSRSDSEFENINALFDDALGVFQSVHEHGVMPGANVFMIKFADEFRTNVYNRMVEQVATFAEDKQKHYLDFTNKITEDIIDAYSYVYSFIVGKDKVAENIAKLQENKENVLYSYDAVTGHWTTSVIEAARTTDDVFLGAMSIVKDMLLLRRLQVGSQNDYYTLREANRTYPYHPINLNVMSDTEYNEFTKEEKKDDAK